MKEVVKGLGRLLDKLDDLDDVQADKDFELALAKGAAQAVERAKTKVRVKTGNLRKSLHVGGYTRLTPGYSSGAFGPLKKPVGRGKSLGIQIGSTMPHARLVEMGTRFAPPHPYLRPAVDESTDDIAAACDEALQAIIDRR